MLNTASTNNKSNNKSFIAVEGPIGVGKTTLAKKLAESFQGELILEQAEDNPFLEKFYQDPKTGALPAQLFFLFQRSQQLKEVIQNDLFINSRISDYLMDKDRLFAQITLTPDELNLYEQVYKNLTIDAPTPDLVIYLQAPIDILLKRIRKRGVQMEFAISEDYLKKLSEAYTDFFHYYDNSPLLIVNSSGMDLVNNPAHYEELLEQIQTSNKGRNYFNPTIF